jgi:hypothetical protein
MHQTLTHLPAVLLCPHCAGQAAATAPFSSSSSRRRVFAGSSLHNSSSSINPQAWQDPQHAAAAERASLTRALRFSQHPGAQGLGASAGADSEVHVLCSSELKMAIMSFLQVGLRVAVSVCGVVWVDSKTSTTAVVEHAWSMH